MTEKNKSFPWVAACGSLMSVFLLIMSLELHAQALRTIKGVVVDEDTKITLPGAAVKIKNSSTAVITDSEGSYSIKARVNDVLIVSYVGYEPKTIPVGKSNTINVALRASAAALNEVVVIGYGAVTRQDLTGSVAQVKMSEFEKAPVSSFEEALGGRVAGVVVSAVDGQPGQGMNIVIRGANSLTQSNSPLYVIDGFPVEDFDNGSLNPDDIESINILKDASATAIYGSRGANGVVVIETKKGKEGAPVITFNNSIGIQEPQKLMDIMNPYEFVRFSQERNPAFANTYYLKDGKDLEFYRNVKGINWQKQIFQERPYRIHSLAVRGGSAQTKYSISGSIYDQEGIILNSGYDRYQGSVAIDQTVSKKIKLGVTSNYSHRMSYGSPVAEGPTASFTSNLLSRAWGYRPATANIDNNLLEEDYDEDMISQFDVRLNPVVTQKNDQKRTYTNDFRANAYMDWEILKGLKLKVTGTVSSRNIRGEAFYNSKTPQGNLLNLFNTRGINASVNTSELAIWSNENTLTYTKTFKKAHKFTSMAGFSVQETRNKRFGYATQNIPNEELGISGMDQGTPYISQGRLSNNALASFFTRLNYGYKSRYLFTATARGDGSSKFAAGNKWGFFPSGAFAWNMHEESFMKGQKLISESKLRVSYGITGNNRVGDFDYLPQLNLPLGNSYSFNNGTPTFGAIITDLGNSDLRWESTEQIDLGYDLGLFKNRVNLTLDLYRKTTKDLLLDASLPTTTGFTSAYKNIGKVRNEGLEIGLNTTNISSKDFSWTSNFNISFNRNKILELTDGQDKLFSNASFESQFNGNPLYVAEIGKPAGMFYGFVFDGVYQYSDFDNPAPGVYTLKSNLSTNGQDRNVVQPGDIKYRDLNGDGTINTYDMAVMGRGLPIHTGGLSNSLNYKNFSLNVFFQWSYGNDIYNANRLQFEGNANGRSINQFASYADRWTPENPSNKNFRVGGSGPLGYHNSRVLEDGSYLRLKTFSLGYNIPTKYLNRVHINRLNVSVAAQNLITWTNYSGMDPEVSVRNTVLTPGFDFSAYPIARTVVFALKATL